VDLSQLALQTQGDTVLEHEVLRLFADRVGSDFDRLAAAPAGARREVAHLIVGSARAIGAEDVARLAKAVELGGGDLDALRAAIDAARRFIVNYLRG
jgi:HPt (histidine-containing phosphotransfer) domain-containing protein